MREHFSRLQCGGGGQPHVPELLLRNGITLMCIKRCCDGRKTRQKRMPIEIWVAAAVLRHIDDHRFTRKFELFWISEG